jgi:phasin
MDQDGNSRFEMPNDMRAMAQASFDQARKAFEGLLSAAQKTASSFEDQGSAARAGAKDVASKAIGFAEANVRASLDYAERLLKAKDMAEVMRLHSEYVQAQMRALADQAGEMGQAVTRAAMEAAKPRTQ